MEWTSRFIPEIRESSNGSQRVLKIRVLISGLNTRSWRKRQRNKEKLCADNRYHHENNRVQEGMHENRSLHSLANRGGARRSVEIQSIGYGAVTQQSRVGNWPVQQERSRHRRSPFFLKFTTWRWNTCWPVRRLLDGSIRRCCERSMETTAMGSNILDKNQRCDV